MDLIFLLNHYCQPCRDRTVLQGPHSYEIMLIMVILNKVVVSLMYCGGHSFFCFLSLFCLQYKIGVYYHYFHVISGT